MTVPDGLGDLTAAELLALAAVLDTHITEHRAPHLTPLADRLAAAARAATTDKETTDDHE